MLEPEYKHTYTKPTMEVISVTHKLISKSVEQLAPLIENKTISPVELTEAVLARAEASQDQINAYLDFYHDDAMSAAKKAETDIMNGDYRGMYHGIPMGIKDNVYFENKRTTMASNIQ